MGSGAFPLPVCPVAAYTADMAESAWAPAAAAVVEVPAGVREWLGGRVLGRSWVRARCERRLGCLTLGWGRSNMSRCSTSGSKRLCWAIVRVVVEVPAICARPSIG